ncbi:MAG: sulfatase [Planctomycetota bacterium]|nr:sulfatase [Planctomycetota bacterium]
MPDAQRPPNLIVVFMDDMGYGDMSCFGSRAISTPAMDRIAARGARFTQMYSAAPVCTPSRCALLTGRYAQRAGLPRVLFPKDAHGLREADVTLAGRLKQAGYASLCCGKWHLGCRPEHYPTRHGFERFFGLLYSNDMQPLHLYRNEEVVAEKVDQKWLTKQYTDEALAFMEEHRARPFFVYLAHTMPHIPLHVEPAFRGKSRAGTYGDTIECIDHHLGRIMERLEELKLIENTLVVVTSDNGPWFEGGAGALRGRKFDVYEGGVRMPFVAQWPGTLPAGRVIDEPASLLDLAPTACALAGVPAPARSFDGKDLSAALKGGALPEREALYFYQGDMLNAVRAGKWKLHIAKGFDGKERAEMPQLFDMDLDPEESYNLKDNFPEVVEKLRGMIVKFDAEVKAEFPSRSAAGKG